jgi:hypothetical protein
LQPVLAANATNFSLHQHNIELFLRIAAFGM